MTDARAAGGAAGVMTQPLPAHELVRGFARSNPAGRAVVCGDAAVTYAELESRVAHLARRLSRREPGTVVAVLLERSVESMIAMLAIWRAGHVYLPLDPLYPDERLGGMLADAQAPVVVTSAGLADRTSASHAVSLRIDADDAHDADGDVAGANGTTAAGSSEVAYLLYTSGSTGTPKGASCTHAGLAALVDDYHRLRGPIGPRDAATMWTSVSFDVSLFESLMALTAGAALHVLPDKVRFVPKAFLSYLERERIAAAFVPSSMLKTLADAVEAEPRRFGLRRLLVGAELVDERQVRRLLDLLPALELYNGYGTTECTIYSALLAYHAETGWSDGVPLGRAITGSSLRVAGGTGLPAAAGEPGEIVIAGAGVSLGYHRRPALTAERFIPDAEPAQPGARAYRTGDRGTLRADGMIAFGGRLDRQIKLRGLRIEPGDIENALRASDEVAEATVVVGAERGREVLVAYVVPKPGAAPSRVTLQRRLAQSLPATMIPEKYVVLDDLPRTTNGKVDQAALAALATKTLA